MNCWDFTVSDMQMSFPDEPLRVLPNFSVPLGSWPHVCFSSWVQHVFPAWNQPSVPQGPGTAHTQNEWVTWKCLSEDFCAISVFTKHLAGNVQCLLFFAWKKKKTNQTYISKRLCEDLRWLCWGLGRCQGPHSKYLLSYSQNLFPFPQVVSSLSLNVYFFLQVYDHTVTSEMTVLSF